MCGYIGLHNYTINTHTHAHEFILPHIYTTSMHECSIFVVMMCVHTQALERARIQAHINLYIIYQHKYTPRTEEPFTQINTFLCMPNYLYTHTHVHTHTHAYTQHTCMHTHNTHICTLASTFAHACTHKYACTYTVMHAH